jgi:hypothetical protein
MIHSHTDKYPPTLTHSDLRKNDKVFRLLKTIKSRKKYFQKNFRYIQTREDQLYEKHLFMKDWITHFDSLLCQLESVGYNYNLNKTYRCENISTDEIKDEFSDEIYKSVYAEVNSWGNAKEHFENAVELLTINDFECDELTTSIMNTMSQNAKNCLFKRMNDRLWIQINEAIRKKWYVTFSTLTLNGEHYEEVFATGSLHWKNYLRKIQRYFATQLFGSINSAGNEEYFHSFAVIEEGKQGQLHIHQLMFIRPRDRDNNLIPIFDDPNLSGEGCRREIKLFDKFWPYGLSQTIAVRFSSDDAFGQSSWHWPKQPDGTPLDGTNPEKITMYLLKYIMKSQQIKIKGETKSWRIRTNYQMGKTSIKRMIKNLKTSELITMTSFKTYPLPIEMYGKKIQTKLIRDEVAKELIHRITNSKITEHLLKEDDSINQLLKSTRTPVGTEMNYAKIGSILTRLYSNTDISNQYVLKFANIAKKFKQTFPPQLPHLQSWSSTQ